MIQETENYMIPQIEVRLIFCAHIFGLVFWSRILRLNLLTFLGKLYVLPIESVIEPSNEITITPSTSPSGASRKTVSSGTITPSTGPPEALRKIGKWSSKLGN